MSRIGKKPIPLPEGVRVEIEGRRVRTTGPKGTLSLELRPEVSAELENGALVVRRLQETRQARALHGLFRQLLANMVTGVSRGFTRVLEIVGVGYRAELRGQALHLSLGYSHPVVYQLPQGVQASVDRQVVITLESADKQLLGQTAAEIRRLRPPEPYKGKGIRYKDEAVRRKAGKAAVGGGS
ncbi:MAG: 50S ribosomal protein L6 [Candidatus Binatia bacterium]|nr:MAG: 50S ribosomal protein L6 [Candidatus Binatia bacterium]